MADDTMNTGAADAPPSIFDLFEADAQAEAEGVLFQAGSSRFRMRSLDHPAVQKVRAGQIRRQARMLQANDGLLPPETIASNETEVIAAACTGWETLVAGEWKPVVPHYDPAKRADGQMLRFDPANAKALFGQPQLHRLRGWLLSMASDFENYKKRAAEAIAGNSPASSAGNSSEGAQPTT